MQRTPISLRALPRYSRGEERMNWITHALGVPMAAAMLVANLLRCRGPWQYATAALYGAAMLAVYAVSALYHALPKGRGKKIFQVIDHCTIYLLIAGTYTPITLCAIAPRYPLLGWGLFAMEWGLGILATVLTAIDLKKYQVFSMACYVCLGWGIGPFFLQTVAVLGERGFLWLLLGGVSYTLGAVLYGLGAKRKWMHSVFHLFVLLGSFCQWVAIHFCVFG